ncbi:MAG: hypothetical protein Q9157_009214 [Trypethelium eluteriae]
MEIYVDGGIRRGTDILKAICLGATAVGLGRPFLYSLAYGQEGVEHLIESIQAVVQAVDEATTGSKKLRYVDVGSHLEHSLYYRIASNPNALDRYQFR